MPEFTKPSVVELSVLRGVAGCLFPNAIKAGCMLISVFLLLKVSHVSASSDVGTALRIVLNSVWIGPFHLGVGLLALVMTNSSDINVQHNNFFPMACWYMPLFNAYVGTFLWLYSGWLHLGMLLHNLVTFLHFSLVSFVGFYSTPYISLLACNICG